MDSTVDAPNEFSVKLANKLPEGDGSSMLKSGNLLKLVSLKLTQQLLFPIFLKLGTFNRQKLNLEDKLLDVLYESPAGPISALDILYGHRLSLQKGNHYMAHKCGFTRTVLMGLFNNAGFKAVTGAERQNLFDLWCIGSKDEDAEQKSVEQILRSHLGLVEEVKVF